MPTTQEALEHQFLLELSKHLVKPGLYFMSKPNGRPCTASQIIGGDFPKFCGLLGIYEL